MRRPRGMTLLELLIVIAIMLSLTATTIAVARPALRGRGLREASRLTNVFLSGARNRALETGRPVGVGFERVPGLPEACFTMSYYETPTPYAGDDLSSYALLTELGENQPDPGWVRYGVNFTQDAISNGLIQSLDVLQLDGHAQRYVVMSFNDQNPSGGDNYADLDNLTLAPLVNGYGKQMYNTSSGTFPMIVKLYVGNDSAGNCLPHPRTGTGATPSLFQFTRRPVRMATGSSQLPPGTCIDLRDSGMTNSQFPLSTNLVLIMFSPRGRVEWIWDGTNTPSQVSTNAYLLVADRARLPTAPEDGHEAWQDDTARWIVVQASGTISASPIGTPAGDADGLPDTPSDSRFIAQSAQTEGGR